MERAGQVYPSLSAIQEGYQTADGAALLDAAAETLGLSTLQDVTRTELSELMADPVNLQTLSEVLWDIDHQVPVVPDPKPVKRRYKVTFLTPDESIDSVVLSAYSPDQAAGFVLSGRCARASGAEAVLGVEPVHESKRR